jgi:hypothetical protein
MFSFLKKRPAVIYRVRTTSAIIATPWNGPARHCDAGETIDVTKEAAAQLQGVAVIEGEVMPSGEVRTPSVPESVRIEPYSVRPFPAHWKGLPECFASAWSQREVLRAILYERDNAERALLMFGTGALGTDIESAVDGEYRGLADRLRKAREAAAKYNYEPHERVLWECGKASLQVVRSINGLIEDIERKALSIFSKRIEALDLHPNQVRNLFAGSGLNRAYSFPKVGESDTRFDGIGGEYVSGSIDQMAAKILHCRAIRPELEAKLEEVKAQLETATAVLGAR